MAVHTKILVVVVPGTGNFLAACQFPVRIRHRTLEVNDILQPPDAFCGVRTRQFDFGLQRDMTAVDDRKEPRPDLRDDAVGALGSKLALVVPNACIVGEAIAKQLPILAIDSR